MKKNNVKKLSFAVCCVLLTAAFIVAATLFGVANANTSYDAYALGEITHEPGKDADVVETAYVDEESSAYFTKYYETKEGELPETVNMYKINIDANDPALQNYWVNTLFDNNGCGILTFQRVTDMVQDRGSTSNDNPEQGLTNRTTVKLSAKTAPNVPSNFTENETTDNDFAILVSATMEGKNYRGESVSVDIYDLKEAGVYEMTSATVRYHFNAFTTYAGTAVTGVTIKDETITVDMSDYNFVFTSEIILNAELLRAYGDNFGLSKDIRTYTGEDVSGIVAIHKDGDITASEDRFYFSADNRAFVSSVGNGFGSEYATSSNTNLAALEQYLSLQWYKKSYIGETVKYERMSAGQIVRNAGEYMLKIGSSAGVEYDIFEPVVVKMGGSEFSQGITIEKRTLNVDVVSQTGISVKSSKTYDTTNAADKLFMNVPMNSSVWEEIGGLAVDADAVKEKELFAFDGTIFNDASIGENKTIFLKIAFIKVSDIENENAWYYVTQNYIVVPLANGVQCASTANGYNLGARYAIDPNELSVKFSNGPEIDGKDRFPDSVVYGDYMRPTDFNFVDYIVMDGATETARNSGTFTIKEHSDWQIVIGEPSSASGRLNTLYLTPVAAIMNNSASNAIFTDKDGNKYTAYNNRLYTGRYYVVYTATAVYSTDNSSKSLSVADGFLNVPSYAGTNVFRIVFSSLQMLDVRQKEITININSITLDKDYDGTNKILAYNVTAEGIVDEDNSIIEFVSDVRYAYLGAGNSVPIVYDFYLQKKEGSSAVGSQITSTINSYSINASNKVNGTGYANIDSGKIIPLSLTVEFVGGNDVVYRRRYATDMYVAVTGAGIPDGYYYFYVWNGVSGTEQSGFCLESELSDYYGDSAFVKLRLSGFLNEELEDGEGFSYGDTLRNNFMILKNSGNVGDYQEIALNAYELLSWYDTENDVPINIDTISSEEGKSYRLEVRNGYTFTNYQMVMKKGNYARLVIEKCELTNQIKIKEDDNYSVVYDKNSHISDVFDKKVDITGHPEATQLTDYASFLYVDRFVTDCTDSSHNHVFTPADVQNLRLSGEYFITLNIPATVNYKPYTDTFTFKVSAKEVVVYLTYAHRLYGDPEVEYNDYKYITDITAHEAYIDSDGNPVDKDFAGKNTVYAFDPNNLDGGNFIMYCGFVDGDEIDINDEEQSHAIARVELKGGVDKAGQDGRVKTSGAAKHNYVFKYIDAVLYVRRKPLTLSVDAVQAKDYTGQQAVIDYVISGGPGKLGMYVIGYTPNIGETPVKSTEEDETKTEVIESGEYILKVYAKPDGNDADNYAASEERYEVRLTLNKIKIGLKDGVKADTVEYDGDENGYKLNNFNDYFVGIGADGSPITAESIWGSATISEILNVVDNAPSEKAINAGKYVLTVRAVIMNTDNIFFDSESADFTYDDAYNCTFTIELTVEKSSDYTFKVTKSEAISLVNDIYTMIYSGYDEESDVNPVAFGYDLTFINKNMNNGEINVITTIDGVLYASDLYKYKKSLPSDVTSAANIAMKIAGVNYDISGRKSLLNVGEYTIKYYVNSEESVNYNQNFVSFEREYTFVIEKKDLKVYIEFDEADFDPQYKEYVPYKIYKTPNAELEKKAKFLITGWVREEGSDESITSQVVGITIDWTETPEDAAVNSQCFIGTVGGVAPDNYYLDHSATKTIRILPADSSIIVYGSKSFEYAGSEFDGNLAYSFDKIYRYDTDTGTSRKILEYADFNKDYIIDPTKATETAINSYFYYDYCVYGGREVTPGVLRMAGIEPMNEYEENIGTDGIKVRFIGLFVGTDKYNITDKDIAPYDECKDVGEYVFAISVNASQNYKAIPEKYYYLKVVKNKLTVSIITDKDPDSGAYIDVSKTYDKALSYPTYKINYTGFVGEDDEYPKYKNDFYIKHISEYAEATVDGITELGLVHPYYEILNSDMTKVVTPIDAGNYKIRIAIDGEGKFGIARNYEIVVSYDVGGTDYYPNLIINKRPVAVKAGEIIQKTYDATDKVTEELIKNNNYVFTKVDGVAESGIVDGDAVSLIFDLAQSKFGRINVLDENGENSLIDVTAVFTGISDENYIFSAEGNVIILKGQIVPATADIRFYSDTEHKNLISIRHEVTYDSERHPVEAVVRGVLLADGTNEEVSHTLVYICDSIHYNSTEAPSLAETYQVQLTVTDTNYVSSQKSIELIIHKAEADIVFGGDAVQVYGAVDGGLTAKAMKDFANYRFSYDLTVNYYDADGNYVPDIRTADAGKYTAVAEFGGNANFDAKRGETAFTIKRREMRATFNVYSGYPYTGKEVSVDVYFDYNGKIYRPDLIFDYLDEDGTSHAYNYGSEKSSEKFPVSVGRYLVSINNGMKNFDIVDDYKVPFEITKVTVTVKIKDYTVTEGATITPTFDVTGTVNSESLNAVFTTMPAIEYYSVDNGAKLDGEPVNAGVYRMMPYGGESQNYNIEYKHGILNVNQKLLNKSVSNSKFATTGEVLIEGSFDSNVSLIVRTTDTIEYNQYVTVFESARLTDENLADYSVFDVYYLKLSNGSVVAYGNDSMTVKIKAKYYFDSFPADGETENKYYVARISGEGEVELIEATKEDDYLVFSTDKLEAFALLAPTDTVVIKTDKNYDWLLYVGIGVGVVLIAVALIIVKVRE